MVETKSPVAPIGICGLLKRDALEDVDIGYALLPEFWSQGYALEAASAVVLYAREKLGLKRVAAVTNSDNQSSIRLLEKMGFKYERMVRLSEDSAPIKLFVIEIQEALRS
jgi:RimJ/RimL family protein N-acetyltransferase